MTSGTWTRTTRTAAATAAAVLAWLCLSVAFAGGAAAHASLVGTTPGDGARLEEFPGTVTLTFSENVAIGPESLTVQDTTRKPATSGAPSQPDGPESLSVPLKPDLPEASYVVRYSVLSADGHRVNGAYAFVVGDGPLAAANGGLADDSGTDVVVRALLAISRAVSFMGLAALGGLALVVVSWPRGRTDPLVRRILTGAWWAAFAGSLGTLAVTVPYVAQKSLAGIADGAAWSTLFSVPLGKVLVLRLLALLAFGFVASRLLLRDVSDRDEVAVGRDGNIAILTGFLVLVGFAGAGHAESGIQPTAIVISDLVHLGALSVWLGSLLLLSVVLLPRRPAAELAAALPGFSRLAFGAVVALALTGSYQAWRQVGSWQQLWTTDYGRFLLVKLLFVACLLGCAQVSRSAVARWRSEPLPAPAPASSGGTATAVAEPETLPAQRVSRLRMSVGLEVVIAVVVLALSALLVSQTPSRVAEQPSGSSGQSSGFSSISGSRPA